MKSQKVYRLEKAFKEEMALMRRDDVFVRQMPSNKFVVTAPHPTEDAEYVLSTWEARDQAREFADIGRAVRTALKMGARSIHFKLLTLPADSE